MLDRLKQRARTIKLDMLAIYLAARDPRVPWYAKAVAAGVIAYALSPIDLIPDFVPLLGYLDDLIIVPLGIMLVVKLVPSEIMAEHRTAASATPLPVSKAGAAIIVGLWVLAALLLGWLVVRHRFSN
jgi:uncharacterized membrane protein YkvA (DUF1232 family)